MVIKHYMRSKSMKSKIILVQNKLKSLGAAY